LQSLAGTNVATRFATLGTVPLIAIMASVFVRWALRMGERVGQEHAQLELLGRYFSPEVTAAILDDGAMSGAGENREVTVLMTDLRGFTELSSRMQSHEVVALLREYHERMLEVVFAHGGTLDKFIGDGLLAYFGAPTSQSDHADRAVRCARDLNVALEAMNTDRRPSAPLRMGVGVHSGTVTVGNVGTDRRLEFTIIGDPVNVASRVEALTKEVGHSVLVSVATRKLCTQPHEWIELPPHPIRGLAEPLVTYAVRVDS
jgi:class 3 adenylate cyclase